MGNESDTITVCPVLQSVFSCQHRTEEDELYWRKALTQSVIDILLIHLFSPSYSLINSEYNHIRTFHHKHCRSVEQEDVKPESEVPRSRGVLGLTSCFFFCRFCFPNQKPAQLRCTAAATVATAAAATVANSQSKPSAGRYRNR